nr:hypothetical protein [Nitrospiraceae bacterium]
MGFRKVFVVVLNIAVAVIVYACGGGTDDSKSAAQPSGTNVPADHWIDVSMGKAGAFVMAVKSDGTVWSAGYDTYGNLGDSIQHDQDAQQYKTVPVIATFSSSSPEQHALKNVKLVAAGMDQAFALDKSNILWAWGNNTSGLLGTNDPSSGSGIPWGGIMTPKESFLADKINPQPASSASQYYLNVPHKVMYDATCDGYPVDISA